MAASDKLVLVQPVNNALGDKGVVIADLAEGSHKISSELIEKIRSGKMDYSYGTNDEELSFTFNQVVGDQGQEQLKNAIKKKLQVKVWIIDRAYDPTTQMHKAVFAYTVVEEYEGSFDDEESTIEVTLKVKIESVDMEFPKLPDSILDPASAVSVEPELPGDYTGPLEMRTNQATAPAGA